MTSPHTSMLDVLVAGYEGCAAADADIDTVRTLVGRRLGEPPRLSICMVCRVAPMYLRIDRSVEPDARTDPADPHALVGLAAGLVASAVPKIDIGADLEDRTRIRDALPANIAHVRASLPREELVRIAAHLDSCDVAVVAIYDPTLADELVIRISGPRRVITSILDAAPHAAA
jgi:hypothetical protein